MYNNKFSHFLIEAGNIEILDNMQKKGFSCFWYYPIHSFFELKGILEHNPAQIKLGEPLCFDLDKIKTITQIPLRLVPNQAYEPYISRENGICGTWIRPEDVDAYEPYVSTLDFIEPDLKKEQILLKIYSKDKQWPGNLNLLIAYLNFNIDNRAISPTLVKKRLNCGQKCMSSGTCHQCEFEFSFAETMRKIHEQQT